VPWIAALTFGQLCGEQLARIIAAAGHSDPPMRNVAAFRVNQFLEEMEQKFGEAPDEYLEYRSRVKMSRTEPDGSVLEGYYLDVPLAPSVKALHNENFARSIRETNSAEHAAYILENMPKLPKSKIKKSSKSLKGPKKSRQRSRGS
jgi:hypothetical protein